MFLLLLFRFSRFFFFLLFLSFSSCSFCFFFFFFPSFLPPPSPLPLPPPLLQILRWCYRKLTTSYIVLFQIFFLSLLPSLFFSRLHTFTFLRVLVCVFFFLHLLLAAFPLHVMVFLSLKLLCSCIFLSSFFFFFFLVVLIFFSSLFFSRSWFSSGLFFFLFPLPVRLYQVDSLLLRILCQEPDWWTKYWLSDSKWHEVTNGKSMKHTHTHTHTWPWLRFVLVLCWRAKGEAIQRQDELRRIFPRHAINSKSVKQR